MFAIILPLFCVLVTFVFMKVSNSYKHWTKKGVKGPQPKFLYGNFKPVLGQNDSIDSLVAKFYKQYKEEKIVGLYKGLTPMLLVRDADLIKKVLVKDFSSFTDKNVNLTNEPLLKHLLSLDGEEWKILRQKLTPLFSNSKLKNMIPLLNNCGKDFVNYINKLSAEKVPREMKDLSMKYNLKAIASVAFGIEINTFSKERSTFIEMAKLMFKPNSFLSLMIVLIDGIIPGIFKKIPVEVVPEALKSFFLNLVKKIVKEREGKPKVRKDFMDLMIELKEQGSIARSKEEGGMEIEVTEEFITAQASLFYAAGFETSSSTMSFMLYELALNLDIQERCYEESKTVLKKYNGEMTYEAVNELEYMSMAFDEALRKHPVVGMLIRYCVKDYEIPELNLTVDKGTIMAFSVFGMHQDSKYYPEPEKYDPERFSAENKKYIQSGSYLAFGDGPRTCIAPHLAKVQSILGLAHFLYNYRVTPCEKTSKKIRYDPGVNISRSIDGIWLNIERRS